jgi:hypothetical protein
METMFNFISNVGFPIVITIYLICSFQKTLNELTKAITELKKEIVKK